MRRTVEKDDLRDIDECKAKINAILAEYNCELISADEWNSVLIRDKDTDETRGILS